MTTSLSEENHLIVSAVLSTSSSFALETVILYSSSSSFASSAASASSALTSLRVISAPSSTSLPAMSVLLMLRPALSSLTTILDGSLTAVISPTAAIGSPDSSVRTAPKASVFTNVPSVFSCTKSPSASFLTGLPSLSSRSPISTSPVVTAVLSISLTLPSATVKPNLLTTS